MHITSHSAGEGSVASSLSVISPGFASQLVGAGGVQCSLRTLPSGNRSRGRGASNVRPLNQVNGYGAENNEGKRDRLSDAK